MKPPGMTIDAAEHSAPIAHSRSRLTMVGPRN
jgi:hypothetical protein